MLESMSSDNVFQYKKLTPEEQKQRGILGRLVGVMADSVKPTRNGRKYSADLWEKVFSSPLMKEKIDNRVCFGEACHPADGREEVDPEKVAICLAEVPKKNSKGQLIGVFDILDTPCGRILKTMADYGANIGVSSRGSGDTVSNYDGTEDVDPDSYDCVCWDAVFVPAVKEARLKLVTESYNGKTLVEKLKESINEESEDGKRVAMDVLDTYGINFDEFNSNVEVMDSEEEEKKEDLGECLENNVDIIDDENHLYIDEDSKECLAVVDDKAEMMEELQRVLKENRELAITVACLQEKLSVSYTKEAELKDELEKYGRSIKKTLEEAKKIEPLKKRIDVLTESLSQEKVKAEEKESEIKKLKSDLNSQENTNHALRERFEELKSTKKQLKETLSDSTHVYEEKSRVLTEQVDTLKEQLKKKDAEITSKIQKSKKVVESYKGMVDKAVSKYISLQADMIGVSPNEIKNRLSESYTFDDIDSVCESLRTYKLSINKLPFRVDDILSEGVSMKVTPSKNEYILPENNYGDEVDQQLKNLAGL